jgi:DNA-binding CsgD family transcriptional regulator
VDQSFVGRDAELGLLRDLLAKVATGTGGAVLVEGEQGIGKSSLLRTGLDRAAAAGCRTLWGAAYELDQRFPLRLMEECLGPATPEPARAETLAAAAGAFAGDPVLAGVEQMLARMDRLCVVSPVVLVTDDLHWADEVSLLVWHRLARAVGQLPLLLAGTYRPGTGSADLERLRRGLAARGGHVIELGPLPGAQVAKLVGSLLGGRPGQRLAGAIGHAGGNPLYARELADGLVRDGKVTVAGGVADIVGVQAPVRVPDSLDAAIAERLAALAENAVALLRWAAVLGAEFSVTDLQAVSGQSAGDLMGMISAAIGAEVLAEAGERLAFRHGVIRQVLYEGLPAALRAALHLQAARALADAGATAERVAAQLAAAQRMAGPDAEFAPDWVADWLAAKAPALSHRAPQVAAELLRGVLAGLAGDDDRREILEASLAIVSFLLLRAEDVERIAGRLADSARDPDRAAEMAWLVAYSRMRQGRIAEADAAIATALARHGQAAAVARLMALRAMIALLSGQLGESARIAEEALAAASRLGDRLAAGFALHVRSMLSAVQRDNEAALAENGRALDVIRDDPQATDLQVLVLANRISLLSELDRWPEAMTEARRGLALAERAGTPRVVTARQALAEQYFTCGQWDDALAELEPSAGLPGPDYLSLLIHGMISLIAAHRDDWQIAEEHLGRVPDELMGHPAAQGNMHYFLIAKAMVAERATGAARAVQVLAVGVDPGADERLLGCHLLFVPLARLALAVGDTATAAAAAAAARKAAEREPLRSRAALAEHCQGLVEGDAAAVLAAAGYFEASGRVLDQAAALEDAAELMARQGDTASARLALAAALDAYQRLGAAWDIRRADARLRQSGIRRGRTRYPTRPQAGWEALTPTETKVATLVAEGRSNPDIAACLYLSRNTVQTHVSHILGKLGARSRAEIIRISLQHS